MCVCVCVGVQKQAHSQRSFLPPCGTKGFNPGYQACAQAPLCPLSYLTILFVYYNVFIYFACACQKTTLWQSILSFHSIRPWDWSQVIKQCPLSADLSCLSYIKFLHVKLKLRIFYFSGSKGDKIFTHYETRKAIIIIKTMGTKTSKGWGWRREKQDTDWNSVSVFEGCIMGWWPPNFPSLVHELIGHRKKTPSKVTTLQKMFATQVMR